MSTSSVFLREGLLQENLNQSTDLALLTQESTYRTLLGYENRKLDESCISKPEIRSITLDRHVRSTATTRVRRLSCSPRPKFSMQNHVRPTHAG